MSLPVESAKGKVILLTGANRGIGLATAHELRKRGAIVVVGIRDPQKMPVIAGVEVLQCDTADAESCRIYVRQAEKVHGRIDGARAFLVQRNREDDRWPVRPLRP